MKKIIFIAIITVLMGGFFTSSFGAAWWETAPGGAKTGSVDSAARLPLEQGGIGYTTTKALLLGDYLTSSAIAGAYQPLDALLTDISDLTDPGANRLLYWDDTGNLIGWVDYTGWDLDASDDVTASTDLTDTAALVRTTDIGTTVLAPDGDGSSLTGITVSETNSLETAGAVGIADTEIFIGTGAGTGNYAAISGDGSLANTGALTVNNDSHDHTTTITGKAANVSDADLGDVTISAGSWAVEDDSHDHATTITGKAANVSDADFGDITVATGLWAVENNSHDHGIATLPNVLADLDGLCSINEIPKWSGTAWACVADETAGTPAWSTLTGDTNTTENFFVGTGATFGPSGTGEVTASQLAASTDQGDFSIDVSNVATLDADVVAAAEMADADHGDVSWSGGVATVEASTALSGEIDSDISSHAGLTDPHTVYMLESNIGVAANNYIQLNASAELPFTIDAGDLTDTGGVLTHTTDTGPSPDCTGTTTYQDGEGNCDDISSVYEPAGITESDISDLAHTTALEGTAINSTGPVTDGYVLTADGAGGSAWEVAGSGSGTVASSTIGQVAVYTAATTVTGSDSLSVDIALEDGSPTTDGQLTRDDDTNALELYSNSKVNTFYPEGDGKYNPVNYGAYFDGTTHPLDATYFTNNTWLYPDGVWSGAGSYSQYDIVRGSDGTVYQASKDGGVAEDPTIDTNFDYWFPLYTTGDEADHVMTQYLLARYGRVDLPAGQLYSQDDRPLIVARPSSKLQGTMGWLDYPQQNSDTSTVTVILDNDGDGDSIVIFNQSSVISDFTISSNTTQTGGYGIVYDDDQYNNEALCTYPTWHANLNRVGFNQIANGVAYKNCFVYMRADTLSFNDIDGVGMYFRSGDVGSPAGGAGDSDFYNIHMQHQASSQAAGDNDNAVGVEIEKGEQIKFVGLKTLNLGKPILFSPDSLNSEYVWNTHFIEPSLEQHEGLCFSDAGNGGEVKKLYLVGGKCSNLGQPDTEIYAFDTTNIDDVYMSGGFSVHGNVKGGYVNSENFNFNGAQTWKNDVEFLTDAGAGTGTYVTDPYDLYIGASASQVNITGASFIDAESARLKGHLSIASGASDVSIVGNTFGTLTHGTGVDVSDSATGVVYVGNVSANSSFDNYLEGNITVATLTGTGSRVVCTDANGQLSDAGCSTAAAATNIADGDSIVQVSDASKEVSFALDNNERMRFSYGDVTDQYGVYLNSPVAGEYPVHQLTSHNNGAAFKGTYFVGSVSRGTQASPTTVGSDDVLLSLSGQGYHTEGTPAYENAAQIIMRSDGVWGDADYPGKIAFYTTPDGAAVPVKRLTINNDGTLTAASLATGGATDTVCADTNGVLSTGCAAGGEVNDLEAQDPANILTGELYVGNGTGSGTFRVLGVSDIPSLAAVSETLTNKTIDGDTNTVQDLPYSSIKSTSRSGLDLKLITGTPTTGECAEFNADGDIVGAGAACGSGGGGGDTTIAAHTDTNITTPSTGQLIIYDGTDTWDNKTMSGDVVITSSGVTTIQPNAVEDSMVVDTLTASNYLPLAGGTMTGSLVTDNLGIEFEDSDTNPTCGAGEYKIYADLSENILKKCMNGSATNLDTGAGSLSIIDAGDSSVSVSDTGTDGTITVKADNDPFIEAFINTSTAQRIFKLDSTATGGWPFVNLVSHNNGTTYKGAYLYGSVSGGTYSSPSLIGSNDVLLVLGGQGYNGSAYGDGGQIVIRSSGTWSATANDNPANVEIWTNPDGGTAIQKRVTIDSAGGVTVHGLAGCSGAIGADANGKLYCL